nr:MAG TPA: avirulence protein [Caudoviricetes sp.]
MKISLSFSIKYSQNLRKNLVFFDLKIFLV